MNKVQRPFGFRPVKALSVAGVLVLLIGVGVSTVVAYAIYTVSPEVREKLGTDKLEKDAPTLSETERNRRQHLSSVLSRNEVDRDYAYNRALFKRVAQGWYQFNPNLLVRRRQGGEELWTPIYAVLNLPLINEFSPEDGWERTTRWRRPPSRLRVEGSGTAL